MRVLMLAIFLVTACMAGRADAQQLYKWVDKDGNVTYSDTPPPKDAKNVQQKAVGDSSPGTDDIPYAVKSAMERNPVILFANNCGEICDSARALLGRRGIPFKDRNPEKDPTALDALKAATGGQEIPVLMVGGTIQKGFSDETWHAALTSGGYPLTNPGIKAKPAAPAPPATPPLAK